MKEKNLKIVSVTEAQTVAPSAEQLVEGRKIMENTFVRLITAPADKQSRWVGTQSDLMELVYMAYESGAVRDKCGCPLSMAKLAGRACRRLHVKPPYNCYHAAARARQRKGVRRHTLVERFCWLKYVAGVDDPLSGELQPCD